MLASSPLGAVCKDFQPNICSLEQVRLHLTADVGFVSEYAVVMIQWLDVFDIIYIMDICLRQFIGMYDAIQSAEHMEFVAKEISALRGAIVEVGILVEVAGPSHLGAFTACYMAYLYGLEVNAEVVFFSVHFPGHTAANLFLKAYTALRQALN